VAARTIKGEKHCKASHQGIPSRRSSCRKKGWKEITTRKGGGEIDAKPISGQECGKKGDGSEKFWHMQWKAGVLRGYKKEELANPKWKRAIRKIHGVLEKGCNGF